MEAIELFHHFEVLGSGYMILIEQPWNVVVAKKQQKKGTHQNLDEKEGRELEVDEEALRIEL